MDNQLVFIHLPRTAGTSLGVALANAYREVGKTVCPYRNWEYFVEAIDLDTYDLIGGHSYYPLIRLLKGNPTFITILGEPINRCVSNYYMTKGLWAGPNKEDLDNHTLSELLDNPFWFTVMANQQTRMLASDFDIAEIKCAVDFSTKIRPTKEDLTKAKARLTTFPFVGIKEQFDKSLQCLSDFVGLPLIQVNNEKPRHPANNLDASTLQKLELANEYDLELYEFGLKLFNGL